MPNRWIRQLTFLFSWVFVAVLLGIFFGQVAWTLVFALAVYIAHVLYKVYQIDQAISHGKRIPSLAMHGLWSELQARIYKTRAKSRARKRRHLQLVREVRESTGAISDAGVILNDQFEIVWFNRAAIDMLGLTTEKDIGRRIDNLLRYPEFIEYLAGPKDQPILVPSPVSASGMLSVQLIPYGQEQMLAIARDVTHEVQLERTRRDFVANASHELRSPLTVVRGYLDALAYDDEVPTAWESPIREMLRQVQRMTQILRDLIDLTRLESADELAGDEFVSPREILSQISEEYAGRNPAPKIEFLMDSDAGLLGSESEIYSIFYNLISNAVRFTPPGELVKVVWEANPEGASFSVQDTGIGIAKELIPRITERFFRVDPGRSRASGGTGLGLAIVKHALQRHGGRLQILSEEGVGSTFICEFPRSRVVNRQDPSYGSV